MELLTFLKEQTIDGFLPLQANYEAIKRFSCTFQETEKMALQNGITPLRYKRNQKTISIEEQYTLFQANVFIVGCGGLGGFVAEILTRIGVGNLILCDGDVFEEHNMNRQNFSSPKTLGRLKAEVLKEKLEEINPAVHIETLTRFFEPQTDAHLIQEVDVVVDALDNPDLKCLLAKLCYEQQRAFVHGAIAGYYSQFSTSTLLEPLYAQKGDGVEKKVGNPSFTVCFAASIQSTEVVKLLLGKPHLQTPLMGDLWEYELISL